MYTYILCQFEYGYVGTFYQEISQGNVVRNTDLSGNTLILDQPYGASVIDPNPSTPSWTQQS